MSIRSPSNTSFSDAVKSENSRGRIAVIPDIKCVSPKEGDLLRGRDPVETAKDLVSCGAPTLSVVTEPKNFGGSPELLRSITQAVDVPVLRKDFFTTTDQLTETLDLGASAVLLICASIDAKTLETLYGHALKIGLEPLVEVCTMEEMKLAAGLNAQLVGINNRNIMSLERDDGGPGRTAELAAHKPANAILISESGILTPDDARQAAKAGANAVLIGTALWQAGDMWEAYGAFRIKYEF